MLFSFVDGLLYFVGGRVYLEAMTKKGSDAYRTHDIDFMFRTKVCSTTVDLKQAVSIGSTGLVYI